MSEAYTRQEELLLGNPLRLDPDEAVCDVYGCDRTAASLIPGAALCYPHFEEFRIGREGLYDVPLHMLVDGPDWRQARTAEYVERMHSLPPMQRNAQRDQLLERLAARRIEDLLRE